MSQFKSGKAPVFLALDVNDKADAFSLVKKWSPHILGFKVGPRLGFQFTQEDWKRLAEQGEVFIDYKFFDIPSTVESSVQIAFDSGASYCTVHAMNGLECLKRLAELEKNLNKIRPFKILTVTLLTSFDQEVNVLPLSENVEPKQLVDRLSDVVFQSGLSGLVCSAQEVLSVKEKYPEGVFVTPGIRFSEDGRDDQKRISTPESAWANGATHLVMGRSLLRVKTAEEFEKTLNDLESAWQTA